jgi:hypothetical protein
LPWRRLASENLLPSEGRRVPVDAVLAAEQILVRFSDDAETRFVAV